MIVFFQVLLALLVVSLMTGPVAHAALTSPISPDLVVVGLWAFVWFGSRSLALRWAIIVGLMLDLISFLPFGYWILILVLTTLLISYLAQHFLEASSLPQALLALLVGLTTSQLITSLVTQQFSFARLGLSILSSLLLGTLLYYVFAVRFRLLQRWLGRRL